MPIYEYTCQSCGQEFETLVLGRDEVACPKCRGRKVKRMMSTFAHKGSSGRMVSSHSSCQGCAATSCATCH